MEIRRREEEERLRYFQRPLVHLRQREVLSSKKRFKAVLGGNRTGKSYVGAIEAVLWALGRYAEKYIQSWLPEDQAWWYERFADVTPNRYTQLWVCTVSWDVQRDVLQPLLLRWIPKAEIADVAVRKKGVYDYIELANGAKITAKSYETGIEGFYGASCSFILLDEEPPVDIWVECEKRVMDCKGSITLPFTPLHGLTWSHDRFYLNTTNDPETACWHFTWDDNPYLDDAEKQRLLASMSPDEVEARVYGRYLVPGGLVLDRDSLMSMRDVVAPGKPTRIPYRTGLLSTEVYTEYQAEVWEEPKSGVSYIVGVDTAEGLPSGDNSAACVVRADTGNQVAEFATNMLDPTTFAEFVVKLATWYNYAFVVPERNNDGKVVIAYLREKAYPSIYRHRDEHSYTPEYGFPTNAATRPLLIANLQEVVKDAPKTIRSPALLEECLSFVRNAQGRPEAAGKGTKGGRRDDRVFAFALAQWGRQFKVQVPKPAFPSSTVKIEEPQHQRGWLERACAGEFDKDRDRGKDKLMRGRAVWKPESFVRWS